MNTRAKVLATLLGVIALSWAAYAFWPNTKKIDIVVKQLPRKSAFFPTQNIIFGFDPEVELVEVLVESLDPIEPDNSGFLVNTEPIEPGPVWKLVPQEGREASKPMRIIRFPRSHFGAGLTPEIRTTGLVPDIRYQLTLKAKDGGVGTVEFIPEKNPLYKPE